MLAMSAGLAGVFMAVDLVLFYVFWEAMLIPAYFLLWLFGEGERPGRAAVKFVLYTLAGSLLMLVGVIGEYVATGKQTFDLATLATHRRPRRRSSSGSSSSSRSRSRSRPRCSPSTAGCPTRTWPRRRRC